MKTKGLCVLVALLSTCWTCVAQVGETKELPKKAKLARISYSGYEITGYVYKKQFVEGQRLLIKAYQDGTGDDTIAEGVYSVTNAGPCLDGLVKRGSGGFTWKGTFKIVNNTLGELTPRRSF